MYNCINLSSSLDKKNFSAPFLAYVAYSDINNIYQPNLSTHKLTEIMVIIDGSGKFVADDRTYDLKKNDVFIIKPDVLHGEYVLPKHHLTYYILGINNVTFNSNNPSLNLMTVLQASTVADSEIVYYATRIYKEAFHSYSQRLSAIKSLTDLFLIETTRLFTCRYQPFENVSSSVLVNNVSKYITENFSEPITITSLCTQFYCSPSTLAHSFKKHMGISIIDYLMKKRLEEAKLWLTISPQSISYISGIVGFSSTNYFTRYFKKELGISPKQFRILYSKQKK